MDAPSQSTITLVSTLVSLAASAAAAKGFALTPDQTAYLTSAIVGVTATAAHWLGGLFHANRALPPPTAGSVRSPSIVGALALLIGLLMVSAAGLTGCAEISKLSTPAAQPFVQVAVDLAVARAVGTDPTTQQAQALKIKTIAQEVLAIDTGSSVPLSALEATVTAKIATLHLQPADAQAAQILVVTLGALVQQQIGSATTGGAVTPDTKVAVAQICNFVITATSVYGV